MGKDNYVPAKTPDILGAALAKDPGEAEAIEIRSTLAWDYSQLGADAPAAIERTVGIKKAERRLSENAIAIGTHLNAMKELLTHGQWESWRDAECSFSERMARNFMAAATKFGAKTAKIAVLKSSVLYMISGDNVPDEAVEQIIEQAQETGKSPTIAEAKAVIAQHKPAPAPMPDVSIPALKAVVHQYIDGKVKLANQEKFKAQRLEHMADDTEDGGWSELDRMLPTGYQEHDAVAAIRLAIAELRGETAPTVFNTAPPVAEQAPVEKPHVAYNSGNNEWYTPDEFVTAARRVLGTIDLDPASSDMANGIIKAETYFTVEDDGLSKHWQGRVWMNPPYSSGLVDQFAAKLVQHVGAGDISEAIVLVNNATETDWFQSLLKVTSVVCFPNGRVRFWQPSGATGAPLQGQAVLYIGQNDFGFCAIFRKFGACLLNAN